MAMSVSVVVSEAVLVAMPVRRVRLVKNELGGSATHQELRVWGHNGMNRGTEGGGGCNPSSLRILPVPVTVPESMSVPDLMFVMFVTVVVSVLNR